MRHRWIRTAGLGPAFLAIALAISPVPAATARTVTNTPRGDLRAFWDRQEPMLDQALGKALRATADQKRWEILVDVEKSGDWDHQGYLVEVFRRRPESSKALDPAVKSILDSFGPEILIGEVRTSKGERRYVVAAVLEGDSSLQDSAGTALKHFIPLHAVARYEDASRFAQIFEKLYNGSLGNGDQLDPSQAVPGTPERDKVQGQAGCFLTCKNNRQANYNDCLASYLGCVAIANLGLISCVLGCAGVPVCEVACITAYIALMAACALGEINCRGTADQIYALCIATCPSSPPCSATATRTATAAMYLDRETALSQKLLAGPIDFPLSRAEMRGEQSFVLDEWAIVQNGWVKASSNPQFGLAVTRQGALPAGPTLIVQEPIHDMNSRHVAKPEVRISGARLPRPEKGKGEIVAARLELSSATDVDRVEILYTSQPMDKTRLEQLVSRRVGLQFEAEKEHRTAVYVIFRLTDRLELLSSLTAFPKCCCGGEFCL